MTASTGQFRRMPGRAHHPDGGTASGAEMPYRRRTRNERASSARPALEIAVTLATYVPEKTVLPFGSLPFQNASTRPAGAFAFRTTRRSWPVFEVMLMLTRAALESWKPIVI